MIHKHICPVCGSDNIKSHFNCPDHSISGEIFNIWECNGCTHRFTSPYPGEDAIGAYYKADHYISHSDSSKGLINRLYKIARKFTLSEKKRYVQRRTGLAGGTLLEVGTGTGAFLNLMEENEWQTTGIEPDYQAREKAMLLYKLPIYEPDHLFLLKEKSFDVIVLWHVLEHVSTLESYMKQFFKVLKPNGKIFIAVPNYTSHDADYYQTFWAAYDVPRHLHHFSPQSLETLANQYGFFVAHKRRQWLDAFYISMLSEHYKQGKIRVFSAFWRGFVSNLKSVFEKSKCSSLIYVLQKK